MTDEQQALMQRWKSFLAKIDTRLDELIAEAQAGVEQLAEDNPADTMPLNNALSGLDHRISQLRERIEETWESKVEDKFQGADNEDGFLDSGLDARKDFEIAFDEKWAVWKAGAVADYYRKMYPLVERAWDQPVTCSNCGADLEVPDRQATCPVSCPHCGTVNQVIPDPVIQTYYGAGPHAFGEERAISVRYQIERFREEVDRWRRAREWAPEPIESMEKWESLELCYWKNYAEAAAECSGKPVDEELIESRMAQFRQFSLENDQRWRKAKGL